MVRLIKRYESRKLYDTEESRYVSLDDVAHWVREGQEVKVVDNATGADATAQTLTQIILEEGRKGTSFLPSELLHELVRLGERAVSSGVEHVQHGVDRLVQASLDRLTPIRRAREEMSNLRARLEELEVSLQDLEAGRVASQSRKSEKSGARKKSAKTKTRTKKATRPSGRAKGGGR